jgi:tetratricopeptide (TPR) repeat protein
MSRLNETTEQHAQKFASDGLGAHKQGKLAEAEDLYLAAISTRPDHFVALHLLGVVYMQTGRMDEGVAKITSSLTINPVQLGALGDLSTGLIALKRYGDALETCDKALDIDPEFGIALGNRAAALRQLGRNEDALQSYIKQASLAPSDARPVFNAGVVAGHLRRPEDALSYFERALTLDPGFAAAHRSRGIMLRALQRPSDAVESFAQAITLGDATADNYGDLGAALLDLCFASEALLAIDQAIALNPDQSEAHSNRGVALTKLRRFEDALTSFDHALAVDPDCKSALCNRAASLLELQRPGDALASCNRAIELDPGFAEAHHNRAAALHALRRLDEAVASCNAALTLEPRLASAFKARGIAFHELGQTDRAIADLEHALQLEPDDADTQYHLGTFRLATGDYRDGWRLLERRWETPQFRDMRREFPQPLWDGKSNISGNTILIHAEQGLGDTLQFCRYVSQITELGADVIFEVQAGLERLLASSVGTGRVIKRGAELPAFDVHVPLMSLPYVLEAGPRGDLCPYLQVPPQGAASKPSLVVPRRGLRVGLCWAGGLRPNDRITHAMDSRRSLHLDAFAPFGRLTGIDFFSLQMGPPATQLQECAARGWAGPSIMDLTPHITDFADTATLLRSMDLVISCDTSTAHLAGALDIPVWILNRFDPCWRWRDGRGDSPWYPSARLFKQPKAGDWASVIDDVTAQLAKLCMTAQ